MKRKVILVLLSAVLALGLVLSGCSTAAPTQPPAAPTQPPTAPTQPPKVLELVATVPDLITENLDPTAIRGGDNIAQTLPPMFETLIEIRDGKHVGILAESWEEAPDKLSWIFHIRKGVKFQDGEDLTAEDVKFSFERYTEEGVPRAAMAKTRFSQIEVVDDFTVRIYTVGNAPYFISNLYGDQPQLFYIVPKDYVEKNGKEYFNQHPIGTGPYKFVRLVSGDRIEYEAWDGYWGPPPAFKKYTMLVVPEETTAVAMLKTGKADMIPASFDAALSLKKEGYDVQSFGPADVSVQFFGTQMPEIAGMPIGDPNVRLALRLAINEEEIVNEYFGGEAGPGVPRGATAWAPGVDYQYWVDYAATKYHYNPEKAKQLISDAGYANGLSIVMVQTANPETEAWLRPLQEIVAQYWEQIGVKVQIESMDWGAFEKVWNIAMAPDLIGKVWIGDNSQKSNVPAAMSTQYSATAQVYNHTWDGKGGAPPELQDMLAEASTVIDKDLLHDLILTADELNIVLPLCVAKSFKVTGPRVSVEFQYPQTSASMVLRYVTAK